MLPLSSWAGIESSAKCAIANFSAWGAGAASRPSRPDLRAQAASALAEHGWERRRFRVWIAYDQVRGGEAWGHALSQCLSGAAQLEFTDWPGVGGFQGGMEDLAPPFRCAAWLSALRTPEPTCLPEREDMDWEAVMEPWRDSHRSHLMVPYVTDYAAHLLREGELKEAGKAAAEVAESISGGGVPYSALRNRALLVLADAARRINDSEWELWALYEAAAGHARFGSAAVHADPWTAEAYWLRCRDGLDCPESDVEQAAEWMLARGSLLPTGRDDCLHPLAARQAALSFFWLAGDDWPAVRESMQDARHRVLSMAGRCPEALGRAFGSAHAFASGWSGYGVAPAG